VDTPFSQGSNRADDKGPPENKEKAMKVVRDQRARDTTCGFLFLAKMVG